MAHQSDYDVVVVGGGVTGVAAATAAARSGARTLLLEPRSFVGGNATTGLCLHNFTTKTGKQVVFGLAQELVDRLIERGGAVGHVPYGGFVNSVTPVDGELFRAVATQTLVEAGVQIAYGATVVDVNMSRSDPANVEGLSVAMKGTLRNITAKRYIDTTGDGDVATAAGAAFRQGEPSTGKMQPVSMILRCFGTNNYKIAEALSTEEPAMATRADHPEAFPVYWDGTFSQWNDYLLENKIVPNRDHKVFTNTVWPNHININTAAVFGVDGTSPEALSKANVELTNQVTRIGEFLRSRVPGFEGAYMMPAIFPGVRQTRNIEGLYEISDHDVETGAKFGDGIGQGCFPIDIHDPDTGQATFDPIGDDGAYDIPYRSLIPRGLNNVAVAGRCISATHRAHATTRNMAACLVTGQAAGTAAVLSANTETAMPDIDTDELRAQLKRDGVYLGDSN